MANKKKEIDQTGYQLDPKDFKTGNFLIDGQVKNLIEKINEADLTGDGVADVSQLASIVFTLLPALALLNAAVDLKGLKAWFLNQSFVVHKQNASNFIDEVCKAADKAGSLFPDKVADK